MRALEGRFLVRERGSSPRREVVGGLVTFLTMAYVIVLNPAILAAAGIPAGPSTSATVLVAIVGTLLMALWANRPIAVAPYMGENAFIAFTVVGGLGFTWQEGLGAVFVAGSAFVLMTLVGIRGWLANGVPQSLKLAFAAGIGLFLAFIGLYESGVVTSAVEGMQPAALVEPSSGLLSAPPVPVKLGDLTDPRVLLAVACFALVALLMALRVKGAILMGMLATSAAGIVLGHGERPDAVFALPFAGEFSLAPIAFELDLGAVFQVAFLPVLLTIFLMDFLDTIGTLIGVGEAGGMLDEEGRFPKIERPLLADALASVSAALAGTTTAGAYVESASGIEEGARTGLAALVTAGCFVASLFVLPLVAPVQSLAYAYAPPLVLVGMLMMRSFARIELRDLTELVPAVATVLMMVLTMNIGNGLTVGLILYPLMKVGTGRAREVSVPVWILAGLAACYFAFGVPH